MAEYIHLTHDKFFKRSMSDIRVAKDFFSCHLPIEVQKSHRNRFSSYSKNGFY